MIGYLEGKVKALGEDWLIIKTEGGVGYTVFSPATLLAKASLEQNLSIFIETIVREDSITLFGFASFKELAWFKSLLKVSGVGAKTALLILSSFQIGDIIYAIENEQKDFFTSVSGIGEKLAVRLVNEMKKEPKKNTQIITSTIISNYKHEEETPQISVKSSVVRDATLALEALGFQKYASNTACLAIFNENPKIELNELIKLALKRLT